MFLIRSTENTPWAEGAIRLIKLPDGAEIPKGRFHLAHAKTAGWLAEWAIVRDGEPGSETTSAQVWDVTEPAPAITILVKGPGKE
jgi:hypothetical protein